jgi:hypothetical protein
MIFMFHVLVELLVVMRKSFKKYTLTLANYGAPKQQLNLYFHQIALLNRLTTL